MYFASSTRPECQFPQPIPYCPKTSGVVTLILKHERMHASPRPKRFKAQPLPPSADPLTNRYYRFRDLRPCSPDSFLKNPANNSESDFHFPRKVLENLDDADTPEEKKRLRKKMALVLNSAEVVYQRQDGSWWAVFDCPVTGKQWYKQLQAPSGYIDAHNPIETAATEAARSAMNVMKNGFHPTSTITSNPATPTVDGTSRSDLWEKHVESSSTSQSGTVSSYSDVRSKLTTGGSTSKVMKTASVGNSLRCWR